MHGSPTAFGVDVCAPVRGTTTVIPRGDLDLATAPELEGWLGDLRRERADVILDLSQVGFMDSSGVRMLLDAQRAALRARTGLRVVRPTRPARRAIEVAGVAEALL
jgi:anti-sigma B factor antagonist